MKQTRQAVCAVKQSIFLDVYGYYAEMENTVDEPWTKCSEFGGCTIYTTGDFPEDSEWGLEDTGIFPLPGHTPSYIFQLVKQGIEGSIDSFVRNKYR
jgi:hypothetical protein